MRIIYDNKIDDLTATYLTALTEATGYPVTNVQDQRLGKIWKTDATSTQTVICEFDSIFDTPTTLTDYSGNGNDGTLSGFGPVAEYHFDGDVLDSSGNDNHGTAGNSPTYTAGVVDQAINFDGTNQYVFCPSAVYGVIGTTTSWSVACWINLNTLDPTDADAMFWGAQVSTGGYISLRWDDSEDKFWVRMSSSTNTNPIDLKIGIIIK
jgi:hypothetical protein